jgi:tellurite resistance protein TerC
MLYVHMNMADHSIWMWVGFAVFILLMLSIDLGLFNRKSHTIKYREAAIWSVVWVSLALIFSGLIFWHMGQLKGVEFVTGYIIELSLSVDNLFVFLLIFSYFKVPAKYQHRVLFWGVMGALIMRIIMIFIGVELINRFHWMIYFFGAFLIYTGINMLRQGETEVHPEKNFVVRLVTRYFPVTHEYDEDKFITNVGGRKTGTLLLLVLITVEVTDLVFALDSIPAILGVTTDRFIVYTSNVFAIMGLRSFFFLLAGVVEKFHFLKIGLSTVLMLIGVKMMAENWLIMAFDKKTVTLGSLALVATILASSVVASLIWPQKAETDIEVDLPPDFDAPFDDEEEAQTTVSETAERR